MLVGGFVVLLHWLLLWLLLSLQSIVLVLRLVFPKIPVSPVLVAWLLVVVVGKVVLVAVVVVVSVCDLLLLLARPCVLVGVLLL